MHNFGYKLALARWACRYSDARPPRKTDGVLLESEIPPRMRGKISRVRDDLARVGITPAYAGKSRGPRKGSRCRQDHPRVCGEKEMLAQAGAIWVGSPPRMRGKVWPMSTPLSPVRITPAYAGKRTPYIPMSSTPRDHPRTCGEKIEYTGIHRVVLGSPPHMRGKVALLGEGQVKLGITLAYARKSETAAGHSIAGSGSPLRMRGKEMPKGLVHRAAGITPAYAGKS